MVTLPAVNGATCPVLEFTEAIVVLLLVHTPDGVVLVRVVAIPVHILDVPEIADGLATIVIALVAGEPQPVE